MAVPTPLTPPTVKSKLGLQGALLALVKVLLGIA